MIFSFFRSHLFHFFIFCGCVFFLSKISPWFSLPVKIYILGYLFYLLPHFLVQNIWKKSWHPLDILFFGIIFYFFIITPFFYYITKWGFTSLNVNYFLIFISLFILSIYFYRLIKKPLPLLYTSKDKKIFLPSIVLVTFFCIFYLAQHTLFFHYYQFIPEWDSYTDIYLIEKNLTTQTFHQEYRPFFQASASIISVLLHTNPYQLFIYLFIPLQGISFLVLYRLFQRYNYHHIPSQALLYFLFLSVPVINMEIDMVRPQNTLLIAMPIIFYLTTFTRDMRQKSSLFAFLAIIYIAIIGTHYHEFFWFFLLASLCLLYPLEGKVKQFFCKYYRLCISILIFILCILFLSSQTLGGFVIKTLLEISDTSKWRWWFLNDYNNSADINTQVSWKGPLDTLKYYSYYISPIIFGILFFLLSRIRKMSSWFPRERWILYGVALLIIWIIFTEILPRLGSIFIPERYWIFFDLTLIFLFIFYLLTARKKIPNVAIFILFLSGVIGIAGSVYIAKEKKSLTTMDEYKTALWIRANIKEDALIISQAGNLPLVRNFAKRDLLVPSEGFFTDKIAIPLTDSERPNRIRKIITRLQQHPNPQTPNIVATLQNFIDYEEALQKRHLYILYSHQKFDTIYASREWYKKQNFYNASLNKFNDKLEKVYDYNGITIWKVF